ncbi:MAG: HesA/MoeB/ThiF family protein [Myxococcales bacterium]|nr:HesA/MoeB/ThiF family protein [Myxococcales bacterium]
MSPQVALVGLGGLGCPVAFALAEAGVSLRLIDEDRVERSNLHRQMLFTEAQLGLPKVEAAAAALAALNPGLRHETRVEHVVPGRAEALLADVALVVEGCDNVPTKFLVSDTAARRGVPVVHGASVGFVGTVLSAQVGRAACYRCVFEDVPGDDEAVDCATAGVYGPVTSLVGALMAAEALRALEGRDWQPGRVTRVDAWRGTLRSTTFARRPGCPGCGPSV